MVVVVPFPVRGASAPAHLEASLASLLRARIEASGRVLVVNPTAVRDALARLDPAQRADPRARDLAETLGADAVVAGTVTELAGRYSLDVRLTPADPVYGASQSLVFTANGEEELLGRLNALADRIVTVLTREREATVLEVVILGLDRDLSALRSELRTAVGRAYDAADAEADAARLRAEPGVAAATVSAEPRDAGVVVTFEVVPEGTLEPALPAAVGPRVSVAEVRVRGNQRIEADAIRARVSTRAGDPYRPEQIAQDLREVYALGFFRNVRVFASDGVEGRIVTFEVEENPVVRQVSITGNESIDSEKIRDALTLTTGSTLDLPLLYENRARIEALYRAQGYYLAKVNYQIEAISPDTVAIHFEVEENGKLRLRQIDFVGNEHFSDDELREGFKTKPWRPWSYVTRFLDHSGTYSEPVFTQDLRNVEQKYMDAGFLRVEISEPRVEREDVGITVVVDIVEGVRFQVGTLDVEGDVTVDLDALRGKLELKEGEVFDRSALTRDVERLTAHYTQRGFYFASVNPRTDVSEDVRRVDVVFEVEKGPLYFIRNIEVEGNTTTVDSVVRREMQLVEGQLYSARSVQISRARVQGLGFFEEVQFEPVPTDEAGLLDLDVDVVERPTGSFSFGAGFSSQDRFVLTGSLAQSNLFGRGYAAQLSADFGQESNRFFLSFSDPYFLDSDFSFGTTIFMSDVEFEDFKQRNEGFDLTFGHALNEQNTGRGFARYSFSNREIDEDTFVNAASLIFREILNGAESTSLMALSTRWDTRDDRLAPTRGMRMGGSVEFAGLGGFTKYARAEGLATWYYAAPKWFPMERSTFSFSARAGYTIPFNDVDDFDLPELPTGDDFVRVGVDALGNIDTDLELPLTQRYFLGGLGTFQLRGFKARSVGPRRAVLRRGGLLGTRNDFLPVGRAIETTTFLVNGEPFTVISTVCQDGDEPPGVNNQGNGNGKCNNLDDEDIDDFDDLDETDVIGGNKFVSFSFEYRFPISESLGLTGIVFLDMGNAFAE
ncbi:MAG: outer membrane protein assembly factor BamA, partial [Deltaproteobacteria bacterium]